MIGVICFVVTSCGVACPQVTQSNFKCYFYTFVNNNIIVNIKMSICCKGLKDVRTENVKREQTPIETASSKNCSLNTVLVHK